MDAHDRGSVGPELLKNLQLAQKGDRAAFKFLIEVTQDRLYRFALYLTGSPQQAQDLCQEAYIKMLTHISNLRELETFWSWLFRIVKNNFLDQRKSAANKGHTAIEDVSESEFLTDPAAAQELMQLTHALRKLSEDDRLVIVLVDIEGYSYQEAGDILGASENAVRSRLHRARQALAQMVESTSENNHETKRRAQSSS